MIRFEASSQVVELQPNLPTAQIKLLVVNESNLIDYFVVSSSMAVDNTLDRYAPIQPEWLSFQPATFDLRPLLSGTSSQEGETQQTILLDINLPVGILAGTYNCQLVVTARSGPDNNAALPLTLIVAQVNAQTITLTPPELTSPRKQAIFEVTVSNLSNAPHLYSLYAEDDDDKCQFELKSEEIALDPGQQASLILKVRPIQRNRLKPNQYYPFVVKLEGLPEEATGSFTQKPQWPTVIWLQQRLAGFVPPLLIIVALLLVALIVLPNFFKTAVAADCGPVSLRTVNVVSNGLNTEIYISHSGGGPANILIASEPAKYLPGLFASLISVSPDGRRLAYVTAQNPAMDSARIVIVDLATLHKQTVTFEQPPGGLWPTAPIWSADGKQLALISRPAQDPAKATETTPVASENASTPTSTAAASATNVNDHLELWVTQLKDERVFEPAKMLAKPDKLEATQFYGNNSQVVCWSADTKTLIVRAKTAASETSYAQDEISLTDGKVSETHHQGGAGVAQAADKPLATPANSCPIINPISQNDPRWARTILRTGSTGRIDDYGCAVTAAAIVLNSYSQSNLTPVDVLNNCLGDMAAPLLPANWSQIDQNRCADSKLKGGTRIPFNWEELNANLKNGPVLVGLIGGQTGTQFLVVTNGSNNLADTYNVVDPWDGSTYKTLGYFLSKGYYLGWIVTYEGQGTGCNSLPEAVTPVEITLDGVQDGGLYRNPQNVKFNVSGTDLITTTVTSTGLSGTMTDPNLNKLNLSNNQNYPFTTEGNYSIAIQAQDPGNFRVTNRTVHFSIDTTPPIITPTLVPALPDPATKKYIDPVTINFQAIDSLSGVAKIEYRINQGAWQPYTSDTTPNLTTVKDNGSYDIGYRATDGAGNLSPEGLVHFEIDIPAIRQTSTVGVNASTTSGAASGNGNQPGKTPGITRPGATSPAAASLTTLPEGMLPTVTPNAPATTTDTADNLANGTSSVTVPTSIKTTTAVQATPVAAPPIPTIPPTAFVPPLPPTPVPLIPTVVTNTVSVPITSTQPLNPVLAVSVQLNFPPGITTQLLTLNNNGNVVITYTLVPGTSASLLSFSQTNGSIAPGSNLVININLLAPNLSKQNQVTSFQINSSAGSQTVTAVISPDTVASAIFAAPITGSTLDAQTVIRLTVNNPNGTQTPDHATIIATYKNCATCAAIPVTLPDKATASNGWQITWDTSQLLVQSGISLSGKLCFSTDDSNCSDLPPVTNMSISAGASFSAPVSSAVLQASTQVSVQASGRANHVILTAVYQNNSLVLPDQPSAVNNWTINWNTLNIPPGIPIVLKGQVCTSTDASNCLDMISVSGLTTKLQAQVTFSQDLNINKILPSSLGITVVPVTNASSGVSNINHVSIYATYQSTANSTATRQLLGNIVLNASTTPPWQASWSTTGIAAQSNITLEVLACFSADESVCQSLITYSGLQIGTAISTTPTISIIQGTSQSAQINTTFATLLKVRVSDANNNPISGTTVIFQSPATGASGTFNGSPGYTAQTDSTGTATSAPLQANSTAGSYNITATLSGSNTSVSFQLSNVLANSPILQPASGTTPQTALIFSKFAVKLQVLVRDSSGIPISGTMVTFIAPNGGISGTFANSSFAYTAVSDANGLATAVDFTSNGTLGTFSVVATSPGFNPAYFQLTNLAGPPASIAVVNGTDQSTLVSTPFSTTMAVKVVDAGNNPLQTVTVTFQAPTSGASGKFGTGSTSATATTDVNGVATAQIFTANIYAGSYAVNASVSGLSTTASFQLTNTNPTPAITSISPTNIQTNGPAFTLTVTGSNFVPGTVINFNGTNLVSTYVNSTKITVNVPSSATTPIGTLQVNVLNPGPGGGTSASTNVTSINLTLGTYDLGCGEADFASAIITNATTLGGGIISFNCPNPTSIQLNSSYTIPNNTTIEGGTAGAITLTSRNTYGITSFPILVGAANTTYAIYDMQFSSAADVSGNIMTSAGSVSISNTNFVRNFGGQPPLTNQTSGNMRISGSNFSSNYTNSANGGAISNQGNLIINSTTFNANTANSGGAIYNSGSLIVDNSTFSGNTAQPGSGYGGGIENSSGTATVSNSTFNTNTALYGGGINNDNGTFTITSSTFYSNTTGSNGNALYNNSGTSNMNIGNSTFTGNGSTTDASALGNIGNLKLVNSTIANNTGGGGIYNAGTIQISNSIVYNPYSTNCTGTVTDGGNNLEYNLGSYTYSCNFTLVSDISNQDPLLGQLANNGGPTLTLAIPSNSPAVNAGSNTACASPLVNKLDQRGNTRPGGGKQNCSIGAYEYP